MRRGGEESGEGVVRLCDLVGGYAGSLEVGSFPCVLFVMVFALCVLVE